MDQQLVMTVIARDRPGIVENLARIIADNQANWLESRMAHLGGQFAGILRVSVPAGSAEELTLALRSLESNGIRITIQTDQTAIAPGKHRRVHLKLVGHDRPGIVRQISQALAQHGVNVEELTTECSSAPMSGEILFHANAEAEIPESCALSELQRELEKIASELMVDVQLTEV